MSQDGLPMHDFLARTAGVLGLTLAFSLAGCKSAPTAQPARIIDGTASATGDPADANLALAGPSIASGSYPTGTAQASPQKRVPEGRVLAERSAAGPGPVSGEEYPQTAPAQSTAPDAHGTYPPDGYNDQVDAGQAALEADQPPPPLPVYEQPMATEANDQWTPGYWDYAAQGYYWVPGAWVAPPYIGALWTPGYWGNERNRYHFHHGFWGRHIGFYGGVPYGFGYTGYGYQGGYWNGSEFYYNRSVNRVDSRVVRNVYVHNVTVINNNYSRVSYNGGNGGIPVRPRPQELAALRESRLPPMQTQVQAARSSATDEKQFFGANHGTPAVAASNQRFPADHGVPAPTPERGPQNGEATRLGPQGTLHAAPEANVQRPNQLPPQQPSHPQPGPQTPMQAERPQTAPHGGTPSTPPSASSRRPQPTNLRNAPVQPQTQSQPAHPAQAQPVPPPQQPSQYRQLLPAQQRQSLPQTPVQSPSQPVTPQPPQARLQPQEPVQTRAQPIVTPQLQPQPRPPQRPEQSVPQQQVQPRPLPQQQLQPRPQPPVEQHPATPEPAPRPQVQQPHPQPQVQPRPQPQAQPKPAAAAPAAPHAEEHPH